MSCVCVIHVYVSGHVYAYVWMCICDILEKGTVEAKRGWNSPMRVSILLVFQSKQWEYWGPSHTDSSISWGGVEMQMTTLSLVHWGCGSVAEHSPKSYKVLGSNPSITKNNLAIWRKDFIHKYPCIQIQMYLTSLEARLETHLHLSTSDSHYWSLGGLAVPAA